MKRAHSSDITFLPRVFIGAIYIMSKWLIR
jgi:hypothetical protein